MAPTQPQLYYNNNCVLMFHIPEVLCWFTTRCSIVFQALQQIISMCKLCHANF